MRKVLRKSTEAKYKYTCNYCMRPIKPDAEDICGFFQAEYEFGYNSNKVEEIHRLDLHEDCLERLLDILGNTRI
jgi:hypothetical protein